MKNAKLPWFRMYADMVDDEKLRLLAFEDRWHFMGILCCKGQGIIDAGGDLLKRKVAVKLGVQLDTLDEIVRRLAEVGLIERDSLQPLGWDDRQFVSDRDPTAAERKRRQRARNKGETDVTDESRVTVERDSVTVTRTDTDTDTDTDTEEDKNKNITQTRKRAADSSNSDDEKPLNVKALVAEGVDRQHAIDWLTLRKAKRLPLTPTAWATVKAEAAQCSMTPQQAVKHAVESNWAGFKASWIARDAVSARPSAPRGDRNDRSAAAAAIFPQISRQTEVIDV